MSPLAAGYGGGMSSSKAALESDTRLLAFEAGRKYGVRVNSISAGPLGSRAAKAIGFIDDMIKCARRSRLWLSCALSFAYKLYTRVSIRSFAFYVQIFAEEEQRPLGRDSCGLPTGL